MKQPMITIAYAEDHTLVRTGIIEFINSLGNCRVVADAENGKELIEKIGRLSMPPQIALVDISMPVMDGYDTVFHLRKLYPKMKFIALTMSNEPYSVLSMIKNGATGYLLKNCRTSELKTAIMDVYDQGYHVSDLLSDRSLSAIKESREIALLSPREVEFLRLNCNEIGFEQIAHKMNLSIRTVQEYEANIGNKVNIHTRLGLALFAIKIGLVPLNTQVTARPPDARTAQRHYIGYGKNVA